MLCFTIAKVQGISAIHPYFLELSASESFKPSPDHSCLCSPLTLCGQECLWRQGIIVKLFYSLKKATHRYEPWHAGFFKALIELSPTEPSVPPPC